MNYTCGVGKLAKRTHKPTKDNDLENAWTKSGNRSKVTAGNAQTTVPWHGKINEIITKGILRCFRRNMK